MSTMDGSDPQRCDGAREDLVALLDGELAASAAAAVSAHVAGCAACRRELSRLRSVGELLATLPAAPPPRAGFDERLAARLAAVDAGAEPASPRPRAEPAPLARRPDPRTGGAPRAERGPAAHPGPGGARPAPRRAAAAALIVALVVGLAGVAYRLGFFGGDDGRPQVTRTQEEPGRRDAPPHVHKRPDHSTGGAELAMALTPAEERELAEALDVIEELELLEALDLVESFEAGDDAWLDDILLEEKG